MTMRYSPLVERYLLTHKYETMNNVRGWKMLMTQRSEAQREADRKLKIYKQISKQIEGKCKKMDRDYKAFCDREAAQMEKDEKRSNWIRTFPRVNWSLPGYYSKKKYIKKPGEERKVARWERREAKRGPPK